MEISIKELNEGIKEWNEFQQGKSEDELRDVSKVFMAGYVFGVVNTRSKDKP